MGVHRTRREFLADVGRGALLASVGFRLASELRFSTAAMDAAAEDPPAAPAALTFGPLEALVCLMQETSVDRLLPVLVERLRTGTELKTLVAAAALANARTFGGEDYVGFHTMMALSPAYRMALETAEPSRPLPVLKVLYRNTQRIQDVGGRKNEVLRVVGAAAPPAGRPSGEALRDAVRAKDVGAAEGILAARAGRPAEDSLNDVLYAVEDNAEVHRVVMPYRAWDLLDVVGSEHAQTLLRQSVRYCVKAEKGNGRTMGLEVRALLPQVLDAHHLLDRAPGRAPADDAWVDRTSRAIFEGTPEDAANVAAAALAEDRAPSAVGEAISLAANQLLLRDAGRPAREVSPGKPVGSVHGDSIGVHGGDSANAWRNLARAGDARNAFACLVLGAYQVARDRTARGGDFFAWRPQPLAEELEEVEKSAPADPDGLLRETDAAIRESRQARACALIHRYGRLGLPPRPAFDLLRRYATSEDGALHAEKYYRTASEEFEASRPAFRWRYVAALARVTASEYGKRAAGYDEACRLLDVR